MLQELRLEGKLHTRTLRIAARVVAMLLLSQTGLETADLSANSLDGSSYALKSPQAAQEAFARILDAVSVSSLRELSLSSNDLTPDACPQLRDLLNGSRLKSLDLSHNRLGASGVRMLTLAVGRLTSLDLSYNFLCAEGCICISQVGRTACDVSNGRRAASAPRRTHARSADVNTNARQART